MIDKSKLTLIPDEAVNLIENDLLGTKIYVNVLENLIENCKTPYTVGIFGSWGTGKSSIIKTLKENFSKKKEIGFMIYDAWKYSKDDFRRTFILELKKCFELNTKEEEELFYKDKVEEISFKPKIDLYSVGLFIISFLLSLLIAYCLFSKKWVENFIGSMSFSILLTTMFTFFRNSLIYQKVSITTSKLFAPEKFEEKFNSIITKQKLKKIVIAIDNIDRCNKDQVLEILQTIKTFMELEKVVFLIPVDDDGLRKFLGMSQSDADEFLRKIFNTSIKIKNFSETELYDYGIQLVDKYKIDFPNKEIVISLICQEFTRNPRKIIQFINILQIEFYLAQEQESNGLIPKGTITSNIEILVKLLLLREHYPDIYEMIVDNKNFIQEINQGLRENKFEKEIDGKWIYKDLNIKLNENTYRFFMRTSNIDIDSNKIELFLVNKDIFKGIPDDLYIYIINQDWIKIKELMSTQKFELKRIISFIDYIADKEVVRNKLYMTTGFNILSLLFKIIADEKEKIGKLPQNINALLETSRLWKGDFLLKYPLTEMIETAKYFHNNNNDSILEKIIYYIDNQISFEKEDKDKLNNDIKLLKEFILSFKNEQEILEEIKSSFLNLLTKNFSLTNEFNEIFDSGSIKYLITNDFIDNLFSTLSQNFNENQTKDKIEIIYKLFKNDALNGDMVNNFINKYVEFLGVLQYNQNWINFKFWLEAINNLIPDKIDDSTMQKIFDAIQNNQNFIINNYQKFFDQIKIETYKQFTQLIGRFYIVCDNENQKQKLLNWLGGFFINNRNSEVFKHVINLYKIIVEETDNWPFFDMIINIFASGHNNDLKNELYSILKTMVGKTTNNNGLNYQQIEKIVSLFFHEIINKNNLEAQNWLIELLNKSELVKKATSSYIKNNINKIKLESIFSLIPYIDPIAYYEKIRELLASTEIIQQKEGIDVLYTLLQNKLLENLNNNQTIKSLINELKIENFDEPYSIKINEIKEFLNENK